MENTEGVHQQNSLKIYNFHIQIMCEKIKKDDPRTPCSSQPAAKSPSTKAQRRRYA